LKLKGCRFDAFEEIQDKSQRVLDTLTGKGFQEALKNGDGGTGVCMWEGTTWRVMVADSPYGELYDFYRISPEYSGYPLANIQQMHNVY
jgi:hypothetical protein